MSLYLSVLPTDLLPPLFLFFNSKELLTILPELKKISTFNSLFSSTIFWRKLWRRDISSFLDVPSDPYTKYVEIFSNLSTLTYKYDKIKYLARSGYDILLLPLLSSIADYNYAMSYAASGGYIQIVELMLKNGANDYNWVMRNAAVGGHTNIVKLMLRKGANDYDSAMLTAAFNGHIEIVELMLEKGVNLHIDDAIRHATYGKRTDIVELLKSYKNRQNF